MPKITFQAIDKKHVITGSKFRIQTNTYKVNLKQNQLHSPVVAKIQVNQNGKINNYIVPKPIIISDSNGNVNVFVDIDLDEITSFEPISKLELDNLKRKYLIFKNAQRLGLTLRENVEFYQLEKEYFLELARFQSKSKKDKKLRGR